MIIDRVDAARVEIEHGEQVSIARYYPERTIVSSGLSKWCGAGGWRLGTFTFPAELTWLLDAMSAAASETYTSVSAPIQYAAVTGVTDDDAGIASGVQRAADQLGGSWGITLYIGIGFAPALSDVDSYVISCALATAGLVIGGIVASRIKMRSIGID